MDALVAMVIGGTLKPITCVHVEYSNHTSSTTIVVALVAMVIGGNLSHEAPQYIQNRASMHCVKLPSPSLSLPLSLSLSFLFSSHKNKCSTYKRGKNVTSLHEWQIKVKAGL